MIRESRVEAALVVVGGLPEVALVVDQAGEVLSCHPLLLRAGNLGEKELPKILSCPVAEIPASVRP